MQFPLIGAETKEHFNQTTVFTGDFKNPKNRELIFAIPRKYKFTVVLSHVHGFDTDEAEYEIADTALTKDELTQVIKNITHEQIKNANPQLVDLANSFIKIELNHATSNN